MVERIGILHPGEMGVSVAASAQKGGHTVYWASEGRSPQTLRRAQEQGLRDAGSLAEVCQTCTILLSVCPPQAAEEMAYRVSDCGFKGIYADLNAISPQRAMRIGEMMEKRGIKFVDGGIIGGPAWQVGSTWLYLSGDEAGRVADCFKAGPLETALIGSVIGRASALKMCYAAYTKGRTALLIGVLGTAEGWNVRSLLESQWSKEDSEFAEKAAQSACRVTAKAWRFSSEMEEIADTFNAVGLPGGFHQAAAEVFQRLAHFKDLTEKPELAQVLDALNAHRG